MTCGRAVIADVLARRRPGRIAYAPNYWQWFAHHRNHGLLPPALDGCADQLEMIRRLGLDVFSRNVYCDEQRGWWGGLAEAVYDGVAVREAERMDGRDRVIERAWSTPHGELRERLRYVFAESTLVQEAFAVDDHERQLDALADLLAARRWRFDADRYAAWRERVGEDGAVVAGEVHSPLKMLHVLLGPQNTTFLLEDFPGRAAELLALHEAAMLDLVGQMARAGVPAVMSMDNLDTAFHPPRYLERYAASFYEKAARLLHAHGGLFFIHACGRQRDNLRRVAELGVDGLEGVAFPPLGDVELDEALALAGGGFIVTGGISAAEFQRLEDRAAVFSYVRNLFDRLRPQAHRFILSASCNTPYTAPWEMIVAFRDAWREHGGL